VKLVAAVDVGGTSIKSALVDADLRIIATAIAPTPHNDLDGSQTIKVISELLSKLASPGEIKAVGLAVPGALDEKNGISRWSGNLGWKNLPIRDLLARKINIPVAFGHDVRTGALAELRNGAAKGVNNAIFIPIGTGIAAALIIDGEIRSSDGFAGEIGHVDVGAKFECVCGKKGCLEAASSALAITSAYARASGKTGISSEEIATLSQNGDTVAQEIWSDAMASIATACQMLVTVLAPEVIIFGGGLSQSGNLLINPIEKALTDSLTFQRVPQLVIAHHGAQAGTIGCAMMALDLLPEGSS
jgi:glucokinase